MPSDARLVTMALLQNTQLTVLKLGYNNLGDLGASILADGIGSRVLNLQTLDLGFNNIGDEGCAALCQAISGRLHTLYLAGNVIGEDGAIAIADLLRRRGSSLQKLYLTGNLLGPDGVKAITEAILEDEEPHCDEVTPNGDGASGEEAQMNVSLKHCAGSLEELYLGGVGMGPSGCPFMAQLLQQTGRILVLSLPNCEINDESVALLASSIKANREKLPLQSLQLSFNRITCKGIESLANAVWGSCALKELLLDNNEIADRGAQHIAAILLPQVKTLETLNVGFNLIEAPGIKILMKAVVDSGGKLRSFSVSGNAIDTSAAKAISYALAYSRSLESLYLFHCNIGQEGQRHISAGVVSNSRTVLREIAGFDIGPVVVTLGLPGELEHWNNVQILTFLRTMWNRHRNYKASTSGGCSSLDEEKLNEASTFAGVAFSPRSAPEDATIVVEIAKQAFAELVQDGGVVFSGQRVYEDEQLLSSPFVNDNVMLESSSQGHLREHENMDRDRSTYDLSPARKIASFVASPEAAKQQGLPDLARKRRIAEWLSACMKDINILSALPFNSGELWRLHQHYFSPVVNESGGDSVALAPSFSGDAVGNAPSIDPEVACTHTTDNPNCSTCESTDAALTVGSHPTLNMPGNPLSSLPIMKRKVSYRFLGDAAVFSSLSAFECRNGFASACTPQSVSTMIEEGSAVCSVPPKTKRARRNRSRISFLPRVKAKLDSQLDFCHEKALVTMRQLFFVERAILCGRVNTIDPADVLTHLCGDMAMDAEAIVVDML